MKKILALALLLLYSVGGAAEEDSRWYTPMKGTEISISYDLKTAKVESPSEILVWTHFSYTKPQSFQDFKYQSWSTLTEYDCENRKSRDHSEVYYSGKNRKGKVLLARTVNYDWDQAPPGSVLESALGYACEIAEEFSKGN